MSDVNTNPYVGSGATIGTGQTEFSFSRIKFRCLMYRENNSLTLMKIIQTLIFS